MVNSIALQTYHTLKYLDRHVWVYVAQVLLFLTKGLLVRLDGLSITVAVWLFLPCPGWSTKANALEDTNVQVHIVDIFSKVSHCKGFTGCKYVSRAQTSHKHWLTLKGHWHRFPEDGQAAGDKQELPKVLGTHYFLIAAAGFFFQLMRKWRHHLFVDKQKRRGIQRGQRLSPLAAFPASEI